MTASTSDTQQPLPGSPDARLQAHYAVTKVIAESPSLMDAVPEIIKTICDVLRWEIGAFWLADESRKLLICEHVWHQPTINAANFVSDYKQRRFNSGEGLPGRVLATGKAIAISTVAHESNFPRKSIAALDGLHGAVAFPVVLCGQTLAVMEFFSSTVREPDAAVLNLMENVGSQLGQFIERKRAEQALRDSEEKYRVVATAASDALVTIDAHSNFVYASPAIKKIFGYEPEELIGNSLTILMPERFRSLHREGIGRYIVSGKKNIPWNGIELPGLKKDGKEIPVEISFGEFDRSGIRFFTGVIRDISVRKRIESELKRREQELTDFVENATVGLHWVGPDGIIKWANRAELELLGYSREEYIGQPITKFHADSAIIADILCRLKKNELLHEYPAKLRCKNGSIVDVLINSSVYREDGNFVHTRCFTRDVTHLKKIEQSLRAAHDELESRVQERTTELKASEERYRLLVESAVDYAIYMLDVDGNVISWNAGGENLKGYKPSEIIGQNFSKFYTPEDIAFGRPAKNLREAARHGRTEDEGWRLRKDGTRFWADCIITALKDESGVLRGFAKVTRDMSDRREAENIRQKLFEEQVARQQAEKTEQRIVSLLNRVTDAYFTLDKNWVVTFANPEALRMTKLSRSELVGHNHWDLFPATLGTAVETEYKRAVRENVTVAFEIFYEPFSQWFAIKAYPNEEDGLSVFFRDITSQKHAEAELRAESERLRVTLSSIGDAVIVTDTAARVTMLNPVAQTLTGWKAEDAFGRPLDEVFNIVNEHSRTKGENPAKRALREGTVVGLANHTVLIAKNGSENPIDDSAAPIKDEQGHVLGVVLVFRDITEKHKAETERTHLLKREQEARRSAEHANRMKDEFLAIVSHELRTPLTPILGWTKMLKGGNISPENLRKGCDVIDRNVAVQTKVIEDLLDVSRIISGKLNLNFMPIEFISVIEEAIETVRPAATAKQITLSANFDPSANLINGDGARLKQVVWNLLGNAIKFTPKGGSIRLDLHAVESSAELSVIDTGEGLDPRFLPSLFDRFTQADTSTTRIHGGLGLGLAIVKNVVEAHGGIVSAESEGKGRGATFKIRIPISPIRWRLEAVEQPSSLPAVLIEGISVLVVEDEPDSRDLIAAALIGAGATTKTASSAAEALEILSESRFDVLVSDIGMPYEDGYTLIRKVRQRSLTVPAIALTAFAKPEDRVRALSAGFQMHMSKPLDPAELVRAVASMVKK